MLIFLLKVFQNYQNKPIEIPKKIISVMCQQQLLLKNRGNDNHRLVTQITKARINNGLSITEICKLTGLSYDNYIKYERDEVKDQYKNFDTLKKISDVLNINLMNDYLSFKTNSKERVCSYMELHNLSIRKLAKICNVSITTIKNWRNGKCSPSYEMWQRIFKQ